MSYTVSVDFEQIGIECSEVCDRVESRIAELQKLLGVLARACGSEIDAQTRSFVSSIEKDIAQWLQEVSAVRNVAQRDMRRGEWSGDSDSRTFSNRYRHKDIAYDLKRKVNKEVAETKPAVRAVISQISARRLDRLTKNNEAASQRTEIRQQSPENSAVREDTRLRLEKVQQAQLNSSAGKNDTPDCKISRLLESIDDSILRQFTYMAYVLNPAIGKDELLREGKRIYDMKMEEERQKMLSEERKIQRQEMENAKMPQEDIDRALETSGTAAERLEQLYEQTSDAMVKEKKRKESLKIILKAIKAQGFIVNQGDIVRTGEQVVMRAHKVGGQVANFTVNLDGRFIYDFKGYEGQACQNDIEPFLKDLEEIYGVDLVNRHEIWKNPDRLQNNKMRVSNTRKDTK